MCKSADLPQKSRLFCHLNSMKIDKNSNEKFFNT